jgi:S-layer protein (TIGR01567 family)
MLMILIVSLPANAAVTATSVEVRGTVTNATALYLGGNGVSWNYANFAGFWYDLKDDKSTESMTVVSFSAERAIDKYNLTYTTYKTPIMFKVSKEKNRNVEYGLDSTGTNIISTGGQYYDVVGWMAEKYVGINGKNNKLAKLVFEQDTSDKKTLTVGETWEMGGGYTLTAQSIDARSTPRLAWFVLSKDGVKLDDKVIQAASTDASNAGTTQGVYTYYANIGGESNVPIFVTFIDSVFSGATSDMVQFKYTWLIDNNVLEVKSGDMYGVFKVDTENPLTLKSDSAVSLSKDSVVTLAGNLKFRVSDSPDTDVRFYPLVVRNTPGTWEVRGTLANATALYLGGNGVSWNYANFAGFWYDLKDDKSTETLTLGSFNSERTIDKYNLIYTTRKEPSMFKVSKEKNRTVEYGLDSNENIMSTGGKYYDVVGWMAEKYVGINGKNNKLAKLILEHDTADIKTLAVGQTWEMGDGYTLTAQSIDANSTPRSARLVLSKDGVILDNKVIAASDANGTGTQGVYTYYANISVESNVPIFVTYIYSVFPGATSDMVQLKYTWLIDDSITEVKASDMYGIFKVDTENPLTLKSDSAVSLSKDSVVTLAGNLKFRVSDSDNGDVRFYPMVEYVIGEGGEVTPPQPFDTLSFEPNTWNLVSVPKTLINSSVDITFEKLSHDVLNIKWLYDTRTSNISFWRHPNNIMPLEGYWVYNNASSVIFQKLNFKNITGPNLPPSMILKAGWNLIGHTSTQVMPVSSALISINGKYSNLLTYDPTEGWRYYIVGTPSLQQFDVFEPGRGYWIFMTQDATYAAVDV